MRIPLASNLESRDGTLDQDALVKNGIIERKGDGISVRKRPGVANLGATIDADNVTQFLVYWPDRAKLLAMKDDLLYEISTSAWTSSNIPITTGNGPGGVSTDDAQCSVAIPPAVPTTTVSMIFASLDGAWFYSWDGSVYAAGEATGYDPAYTSSHDAVPGMVSMEGYLFGMTDKGYIFNSTLNDFKTTSSIDYVQANKEPSAGKALAKSQNYIGALKEWSTTLYYNAGNPTGSVLSPVGNGFYQIGCANGWSVATIGDVVIWVSKSRAEGLGVHMMNGSQPVKVSTKDIDRVLALDDLATVYAYALEFEGHKLYVLTLTDTAITLVYDIGEQAWTQWTRLTAAANKNVTSITRSGTTATVTVSGGHGMSDGDPVTIAGADQAGYNILAQIAYVSSTVFTIEVDSGTVSPATGTITATPYTESYFPYTHYCNFNGRHLVMHLTSGTISELVSSTYKDESIPINFFARTARLDGGTTEPKKLSRLGVIGDKVSDTAMIRWSDDDSTNFTKYRRVTLSNATPELRRCGAFERRSIEFRHIGNTAPSIDALELDIGR